jgi:hypothetical protein
MPAVLKKSILIDVEESDGRGVEPRNSTGRSRSLPLSSASLLMSLRKCASSHARMAAAPRSSG